MKNYCVTALTHRLCVRFVLLLLLVFGDNTLYGQQEWRKYNNQEHDLTHYSSEQGYAGASIVDINNDGFFDIFFAPKSFYINDGKGNFPIMGELPYNPLNTFTGCSWADIDNDGDADCLVATFNSRVFVNTGVGKFVDSSSRYKSLNKYNAFGCAIGDLDGDNHLDFVFAHAYNFHPNPKPSLLLIRKQADNSIEEKTGYYFTDNFSSYTNPYWSDYDMDGDMDLFMATGPAGKPGKDYCYKNLRKETGKDSLLELEEELFAEQLQDGQCYNFIDYDNDGDLDLCLTNYLGAQTRLYKNIGNQQYQIISTPFSETTTNLANCWGDYDNDGDMDIVITNDNQITKYYKNNGGDDFEYLPDGFSTPSAIGTVCNGDIDNDGDLDIVVNGKGNNGSSENAGLYINEGIAGNNSWIQFSLKAKSTNSSALGAFVKLYAEIKGKSVQQLREVNAQNTFQGQNSSRVHFGVGDAQTIDSIIIMWPSGTKQKVTGLPINKIYSVVEGETVNNVVENSVGIELKYDNRIGTLFLPKQEMLDKDVLLIDIIDVMGRVVKRFNNQSYSESLDVSFLPMGYYLITIQGKSYRFIKY